MRAALLALALAACATSAAPSVPAELRGCWIAREPDRTVTMRWFPGRAGSNWRGDQLFYAKDGGEPFHQAYRIDEEIGVDDAPRPHWVVCPLDDGLPHGAPCRALSFAHSSEDYHAEIIASADHLHFAFFDEGEETVLFDGARDGCD
ncbi:MAG TPA: hypothetical protein VG943_08825 [Caulobacterales bacterium]|nr:hypothetical protein [Caulobacterales bacterium]